jgi:N-acetyl-gamma-glutamyl-phosphate/LysW-gamma-L-alpha-aminoadipyl-6-phosphate reductase
VSIPVGVVGATGYIGGELLRLLTEHPTFDLVYASASDRERDRPGRRRLRTLHPNLRRGALEEDDAVRLVPTRMSEVAETCSAVFLATPADVSAALAPALLERDLDVVVDLSPAFRLRDQALHERWYPDVPWRDRPEAVYGLPELNRDALAGARLIAAPGCLATAAILALLPLCALTSARFSSIVVDGKTGSTGGGTKLRPAGLHPVRSGVVAPYAPVTHRHTAEIREALTARGLTTSDGGLRLGMSVYGVDLVRGLSVAAYAMAEPDTVLDAPIDQVCREVYGKERFVRVRDWCSEAVPLPDPKALAGSNYCDVAAFHDTDAGRYVMVAALDNLMKGAAGQAIQACNIRYGLPEHLGVSALPIYPA